MRLKKTINVRVKNLAQALELMGELEKVDVDLVAESRPRAVKIEVFFSKEKAREVEHKIREVIGEHNPH